MLKVQEYLKTNTLAQLTEELGIKAKVYEEDNLVLLDYDQINSPKMHPIVIECRSLILTLDTFDVVSRKFDRFFNLGEAPELYEDFDFENAVVMEKADGSLIGIYHNPHTSRWEISTRGMAKAEGEHMAGGVFRDKVLAAAGFVDEGEFQLYAFEKFSKTNTYVFEYCSPENRIVTKYDEPHLVLTAIRDIYGEEANAYTLNWCGICLRDLRVRSVKTYDAKKPEELRELANALPNLEEGFVVWCETTGRRMKVKSSTYLVAHKLRGNDPKPTRKNMMSLVLEGEVDEFLAYFPEWQEQVDAAQQEVNAFCDVMLIAYTQNMHIENQKEFALAIKDVPGNSVMFTARKSNMSIPAVFHSLDLHRKLRLFGL